jgi:hypothetical protein
MDRGSFMSDAALGEQEGIHASTIESQDRYDLTLGSDSGGCPGDRRVRIRTEAS